MLSWFGLVWFGLVWFDLVWFDLIWLSECACESVSVCVGGVKRLISFLRTDLRPNVSVISAARAFMGAMYTILN